MEAETLGMFSCSVLPPPSTPEVTKLLTSLYPGGDKGQMRTLVQLYKAIGTHPEGEAETVREKQPSHLKKKSKWPSMIRMRCRTADETNSDVVAYKSTTLRNLRN